MYIHVVALNVYYLFTGRQWYAYLFRKNHKIDIILQSRDKYTQ